MTEPTRIDYWADFENGLWKTEDGREIRIKDLTDGHLNNIVGYHKRLIEKLTRQRDATINEHKILEKKSVSSLRSKRALYVVHLNNTIDLAMTTVEMMQSYLESRNIIPIHNVEDL